MKHRILLEFSADTLPDDFLDQISGRVYGHPAVDKKECTAAFVGDVLKDAERYQWLRELPNADSLNLKYMGADLDLIIDAAKDTQ